MRIEFFAHNGISYSMMTPQELLEAGVPQSAIDAALLQFRRAAVKSECRRRIIAVANETAQANMNAAVTVINSKTASQRNAAENQTLSSFSAGVSWIGAMRAAVNTLTADASADYSHDASWPECPTDVITLAAQF